MSNKTSPKSPQKNSRNKKTPNTREKKKAPQGLQVKLLISKALGYAILLGSLFVKIPQIIKIVRAGSVKGISFSMFFLELIGYIIGFSYGFSFKQPINTYGENLFLMIQNFVILYLIYFYTTGVNTEFMILVSLMAVGLSILASNKVPKKFLETLKGFSILIFIVSKLPQIWQNYQAGDVGQLDLFGFVLNFGGSLIRIFTTLTELKNDYITLASFIVATLLNGILVGQILYYGPYVGLFLNLLQELK
eukprot:TRINITY_DN4534_c0_g1_i1.p1 TRINITY_DN4534_c0_g1~~TRINITY_DN4534_c0_g1_i1.p1  ORF type:complete len:248 (+),score=27.86 TRINITY_DN4534_c0_g1_i1:67-810(+)